MMSAYRHTPKITGIGWMLLTLSIAGVAIFMKPPLAYLVRKPVAGHTWLVINQTEVGSGAMIPADTHVVFHLPPTFSHITRETLLGQRGDATRYWGYCFPENAPVDVVKNRAGFPGLIFLSEKERAIRKEVQMRQNARFSPAGQLPDSGEIDVLNNNTKPSIRHQLEIFKPNTMCYIMTDHPLSMGLDADNDKLNNELEREVGTNPTTPDSDGDGVGDGVEYLHNLNPLIRDSDTDGIIDGIEDANWNGRIDFGETDPRTWDTDRDGLCDGMCRVRLQRRDLYIGEDKNLNGTVDSGESDPRLYSTTKNGVSDEVPYLRCIADNKPECP